MIELFGDWLPVSNKLMLLLPHFLKLFVPLLLCCSLHVTPLCNPFWVGMAQCIFRIKGENEIPNQVHILWLNSGDLFCMTCHMLTSNQLGKQIKRYIIPKSKVKMCSVHVILFGSEMGNDRPQMIVGLIPFQSGTPTLIVRPTFSM